MYSHVKKATQQNKAVKKDLVTDGFVHISYEKGLAFYA